jgi:hypothetical protein
LRILNTRTYVLSYRYAFRICTSARTGHGITDVMTRNRRTHLNTSRGSHNNYTTLAERFLGASVSVFKGCVTLWGGRWPMNIYIYIYINVFLETRSNPTLLPILFTLPGPPQLMKKRTNMLPYSLHIFIYTTAKSICRPILSSRVHNT